MRRDRKIFKLFWKCVARQIVEHLGRITTQCSIAGEKAEIGINFGRDWVVVAGALVGVRNQF